MPSRLTGTSCFPSASGKWTEAHGKYRGCRYWMRAALDAEPNPMHVARSTLECAAGREDSLARRLQNAPYVRHAWLTDCTDVATKTTTQRHHLGRVHCAEEMVLPRIQQTSAGIDDQAQVRMKAQELALGNSHALVGEERLQTSQGTSQRCDLLDDSHPLQGIEPPAESHESALDPWARNLPSTPSCCGGRAGQLLLSPWQYRLSPSSLSLRSFSATLSSACLSRCSRTRWREGADSKRGRWHLP